MKWLLLGCLLFWFIASYDTSRYRPNKACLVKNKYKHERSCSGPRRKFYAFHRIILDCVAVYTKCARFHKHNEYPSLSKCQYDCAYHMKIDLPGNKTSNGTADAKPTKPPNGDGEITNKPPVENGDAAGEGGDAPAEGGDAPPDAAA